MIEIKHREDTSRVIFASPKSTLKEALAEAKALGSSLSKAYLFDTDLSGIDLSEMNLSGAYMPRANLSGTDLSNSNLTKAILSGAALHNTNLDGADTSGANMSGVSYEEKTQNKRGCRHGG